MERNDGSSKRTLDSQGNQSHHYSLKSIEVHKCIPAHILILTDYKIHTYTNICSQLEWTNKQQHIGEKNQVKSKLSSVIAHQIMISQNGYVLCP